MNMPKDKARRRGTIDKFEVGGQYGPIEDRNEYEQRLDSLPSEEMDLAQESGRFADLCRYLSDKKMDIPPEVLDRVASLARRSISDRIRVLRAVSTSLMEYLADVGKDPQIRQ